MCWQGLNVLVARKSRSDWDSHPDHLSSEWFPALWLCVWNAPIKCSLPVCNPVFLVFFSFRKVIKQSYASVGHLFFREKQKSFFFPKPIQNTNHVHFQTFVYMCKRSLEKGGGTNWIITRENWHCLGVMLWHTSFSTALLVSPRAQAKVQFNAFHRRIRYGWAAENSQNNTVNDEHQKLRLKESEIIIKKKNPPPFPTSSLLHPSQLCPPLVATPSTAPACSGSGDYVA